MLFFAALVFGVLAFGSQVVLSSNFKFQLSQVEQCEPVTITFVGNTDVKAIPMLLTLVPFNSSPISIPIPNAASNTSGVYVTFVPFAAGTTFVASLDDTTGENVAQVSDVIRVLPSPTENKACLPSLTDTTPKRFTVDSTFSQCEVFTVNYNRTVISSAPTVRLYSPNGPSRLLNVTTDEPEKGRATYVMDFDRGKEVVLVVDDGFNHQETTALTTVGGDSASSDGCLKQDDSDNGSNSGNKSGSPKISQGVIIGSAAGGGVIVLISICMLLFVLRERRRRRRVAIDFDPSLLEKGPPPEPIGLTALRNSPSPTFREKELSPGFVKDPLYTTEKFLSPTNSSYLNRASMASWAQATPEDQKIASSRGDGGYSSHETSDRLSLNSLDIECILNMAAVQSSRSSRHADPTPLGPVLPSRAHSPPPSRPRLLIPRPYPARGHLRDPSDVPLGPASMALSAFSSDPFVDTSAPTSAPVELARASPLYRQMSTDSSIRPPPATAETERARSLHRQMSTDSSIRPPPSAIIGLPSSPRSGPRFSRDRVSGTEQDQSPIRASNRSTKDSMGDWYGIAR